MQIQTGGFAEDENNLLLYIHIHGCSRTVDWKLLPLYAVGELALNSS